MISLRKFALGVLVALSSLHASAAAIGLFEFKVNVDGNLSPAGVNIAAFDTATGLGQLTVSLTGAGAHFVGLFTDHDIDVTTNTYFNEFGAENGTPAIGQSWEIDEPDFVFGNIYANFAASLPDDSNSVPAGAPDDVAMALAWNLSLQANQTAVIDFVVSETVPLSGFYLAQTDSDSDATIYFSSRLAVVQVPEPASLLLVAVALVGLSYRRRLTL